ncbi:MAG: ribonuclease HII [bacterium]
MSGTQMNHDEKYSLYTFDRNYSQNGVEIAGIDEAGRGPLAGPVVVAACVLDLNNPIGEINDSKQLKPQHRVRLYEEIILNAINWQVVLVDVGTIDKINILQATLKGMRDAATDLNINNPLYLIDGNSKVPGLSPQIPIIKGDTKSASIAAASIIAKVTRDRYMLKLAEKFPVFGFETNFGYPTKKHFAALERYGATVHHRKSFAPVKKILERGLTYNHQGPA